MAKTASIELLAALRRMQASSADSAFVVDLVADNLAIALAAARTPLARSVLESSLAGVDGGSCTVLGLGRSAPPSQAAFANSALAHILDFDDIHDRGRLHPTTVVLPAALAAGQLVDADGSAVMDGVLLGGEAMCRLGVAISPTATSPAAHWFITQLVGYVGAAIAAGVTMGFDDDTIISAIGLSVMQASGTKQPASTPGSTARAIYPAFAAAGGVSAALLARGGMRGADDALDGPDGLLPLYLGIETIPSEVLEADEWMYAETSMKPWPCCRISHPYVSAALRLREQLDAEGASLDDISELRLGINASAAKLCLPLDARLQPATLQDAKYSIPFMTAFTLALGSVDLDSTDDHCLTDRRILDLAARVTLEPGLPDGPGHPPAVVTMVRGGSSATATADATTLDAKDEVARAKVEACLAGSADPTAAAASLFAAVAAMRSGQSDSLSMLHTALAAGTR